MSLSQPDGFLALSPTGTGKPVLVLHAWWGLNDTLKSFCTRLAEADFTVFAPDLYHGQVAKTIAEAEVLGQAVDANFLQVRVEVAEAAAFLRARSEQNDGGIAVVGFSLGASYALELANAHPESVHSVVLFYGTWGDFDKSKAAYLGHFAQNDEFEPLSSVDALETGLRNAGRSVEFHVYPATGHWFFEPDRSDAFNAEAAELAWQRTLSFLKRGSN